MSYHFINAALALPCDRSRKSVLGLQTSSPFHQNHYKMKSVHFSGKLGADPQPHWLCGKGMQQRVVGKGAISCKGFGEMDY